MEIKVKYPKRVNKENMHDDWMMRVTYKSRFPTKEEIETDYVTLPIPDDFWFKVFGDLNPKTEEDRIAVLDSIFSDMNRYEINPMAMKNETDVDGKKMQQWLKDNEIRHTSMSVGDVIILDNSIYVCDVQGWKEVA